MNKAFAIDTNIAIYAFADDEKRLIADKLVGNAPAISVQLLNEFANVIQRKRLAGPEKLTRMLSELAYAALSVRVVDLAVHKQALRLTSLHNLSFFDALIVSAALLDGCAILYSEDMQHGLVIEDQLRIVNPFEESSV
ncbi:PIN domain-containing protein [Alterisphingorhabdus coralli]|uniref:PIN domain-containing protein n=1 Tax=Alterisphingorhabdus coralli TaxID=3071408 RepID=A0AA97F7Y6_9SPHN|nr:PIN domain-containing protein [Parasphingorhabdus sp. SCSIO 66989]WOE74185.1 PIN domain-containing protein [Parasphingorhabdus sp. SCSIO 66989]